MADKKNDNTESKVFDVAEPEEAKLNIGAKPMVIGHKPSSDPTIAVKDTAAEEKEAATEESSTPSKKIRIEPLNETVTEEKENTTAEEKSTEPTSTSTPEKEENTPPSTEETATKEDAPKEEASDESIDDKKERDFAAEAENQEQSAQDAESAREEKVEELIKSKKYHVTIKEKKDSAFGKVLAVLFAIIVSIVGVYALADADIIPGGELLPMRFIGSNERNEVKTQEVNSPNGVEKQNVDTTENDQQLKKYTLPELAFTSEIINENTRRFVLEKPAISFDYPAELGEVKADTEDYEVTGRVFFGFSGEGTSGYYSFALNALDRIGPEGHDSPTLNLQNYSTTEDGEVSLGYLVAETSDVENTNDATVLVKGENYILFEGAGIGYFFAGIANIPKNETFESIVFDYGFLNEERAYTVEDTEVQQLKAMLDTLSF